MISRQVQKLKTDGRKLMPTAPPPVFFRIWCILIPQVDDIYVNRSYRVRGGNLWMCL